MGWLCHFHRTKEGRRRWKTSNTTRVDTPLSHSSLTHSMALVTMNATDSLVIRKKKESKCLSWTTSPYFYEMVGFVLIKMLSFYLYTMDLLWFRLRLIFEAFSYNPSWLDQNRCCMMSLLDLSACSSKWECVFFGSKMKWRDFFLIGWLSLKYRFDSCSLNFVLIHLLKCSILVQLYFS